MKTKEVNVRVNCEENENFIVTVFCEAKNIGRMLEKENTVKNKATTNSKASLNIAQVKLHKNKNIFN